MITVYPMATFFAFLMILPRSMNDLKKDQAFRIKDNLALAGENN